MTEIDQQKGRRVLSDVKTAFSFTPALKNRRYKWLFVLFSGDYVTISCHNAKFINALELLSSTFVSDWVSLIVGIKATRFCERSDGLIVNALELAGTIVLCYYGKVKTLQKQ